jgi:hypothetical protein
MADEVCIRGRARIALKQHHQHHSEVSIDPLQHSFSAHTLSFYLILIAFVPNISNNRSIIDLQDLYNKMKFTNILLSSVMATTILAYPGAGKWKQTLAELQRRAAAPIDSPEDSTELLGDLISPGPTTPVGKVCSVPAFAKYQY